MKLSHVDSNGAAVMVDVSRKQETVRTAEARAEIVVSKKVFRAIKNNSVKKGDVFSIAKFAGIQAAKKTSELIPLCHNIVISKITVELNLIRKNSTVEITSTATSTGQTGIEMEALTAVSVAALTVYDMCKAIDKSMVIGNLCLMKKSGGVSGNYERTPVIVQRKREKK